MPTYHYVCSKCGHEFDQFQSIKDRPLTTCPKTECGMKRWGKGRVRRQISAGAGLIFKGSGFYITDYRSKQYLEAAKKESAPASSDAGKPAAAGSAGGDGKPAAAKTETKTPKAGKAST